MGILNTFQDDQSNDVHAFINEKINEVITKYINFEQDDGDFWKVSANKLIRSINDFNDEIKLDASTINVMKSFNKTVGRTDLPVTCRECLHETPHFEKITT